MESINSDEELTSYIGDIEHFYNKDIRAEERV
jgi:hypothetical protein